MTTITITGNLTRKPELRFTPNGRAVLSGDVAVNHRKRDRTTNEWVDDRTDYHPFEIWGDRAEALAELLDKGTRVIVLGDLRSRKIETGSGGRTVWEIVATDVGIVPKTGRAYQVERPASAPEQDPWASPQEPPAEVPGW